VRHIPEMLARMYGAEMGRLMGKVSNDAIFKEIKELRGEAAREQPLGGASAPGGIREIKTWLDLATQALRVAGAGELAPRAIEMRTRYEQLGWSEARLKREIEAAEKAPGHYRDPVPFDVRMEVAKAMRESTVDFGRGGILTNEINKITPFFRPAVNGLWKQLNNWQSNTKGAAIALAAYLGLKLTHWLANQDKEWWPNLSAYDRYNNFVVEIGGKLYRIPGARDLEIPVSGLMIAMLDQGAKRNPQWAGLMKQSLETVAPPALPAPVALAWQLRGNEDFMGRPIIPKRDEHLPASYNLWHHQVPYGMRQLTGGRGEVSASGLTGLSPTVTPTAQLGQYYDALHGLEERRTLAKREGTVFRQEAEYRRLHSSAVAARITALGKEYQKATEDRRSAIRREQNRLAAILLR